MKDIRKYAPYRNLFYSTFWLWSPRGFQRFLQIVNSLPDLHDWKSYVQAFYEYSLSDLETLPQRGFSAEELSLAYSVYLWKVEYGLVASSASVDTVTLEWATNVECDCWPLHRLVLGSQLTAPDQLEFQLYPGDPPRTYAAELDRHLELLQGKMFSGNAEDLIGLVYLFNVVGAELTTSQYENRALDFFQFVAAKFPNDKRIGSIPFGNLCHYLSDLKLRTEMSYQVYESSIAKLTSPISVADYAGILIGLRLYGKSIFPSLARLGLAELQSDIWEIASA